MLSCMLMIPLSLGRYSLWLPMAKTQTLINYFENEMNIELGNIGNWLAANKLSLNVHNYKYMI